MRKAVYIKANIDRDTTSDDFELALQAPILGLIAAVLTLACVTLGERGRLSENFAHSIGVAQLTLFCMAVLVYVLSVIFEAREEVQYRDLPAGISREWLLDRAIRDVQDTQERLQAITLLADRAGGTDFEAPANTEWSVERERLLRVTLAAAALETKSMAETMCDRVGKLTVKPGV